VTYFGEFRRNARPLIAASLGLGTSLPLDAYTNSIFAPYLIKSFGWSRSQFALYGLVALSTVIVLPFIGRFTDRLGVKRVALVGTLLMAVVFVGYSRMQGSFGVFLFLSALKLIFGQMTSAVVYTRLIAANFVRARGLALTVVNCAPALLGALVAPVLTEAIESYGWRNSYLLVGAFSLACGLIALSLIPRSEGDEAKQNHARQGGHAMTARQAFGELVRSRTFWIIAAAVYLCMIATPLQSSQLSLMLEDNGLVADKRALVISLFAVSTIVGRIVCGLALDKFPTPVVSTLCTIPPALGFFILATDWNSVGAVAFGTALAGFAVGAESDLFSFVVARYFRLEVYSSTLSLVFACVFMATATGSLSISAILGAADSFSPFLYFVSGTTLVGSLIFLLLPNSREIEHAGQQASPAGRVDSTRG
jgi:sugar phosphate permease